MTAHQSSPPAAASRAPLPLGPHQVWPPVVLAPMAGITNVAFRQLCREQGGGLYVCEMITTQALVERNPKTLRMIAFGPAERPAACSCTGLIRRSPPQRSGSWSSGTWPTTST